MLFQSGLVYSALSVKAGAKWGAPHPFFPQNTQHNQARSRCERNLGSAHLEQCDSNSSLIARGFFFFWMKLWSAACLALFWLPWLPLKLNFLWPVPLVPPLIHLWCSAPRQRMTEMQLRFIEVGSNTGHNSVGTLSSGVATCHLDPCFGFLQLTTSMFSSFHLHYSIWQLIQFLVLWPIANLGIFLFRNSKVEPPDFYMLKSGYHSSATWNAPTIHFKPDS